MTMEMSNAVAQCRQVFLHHFQLVTIDGDMSVTAAIALATAMVKRIPI